MFVLVLFYCPLVELSHDMELAYGSVAHTLLNVNNHHFSETNASRRTLVVCEELNSAVVVAVVVVFHEVHSRGM